MLRLSKKRKNKGFTLVELIIVIAILAVLVGILSPQYTKYVEKSRKTADINNLNEIVNAIKIAAADPDYYLGSRTAPKTVYLVYIGNVYIQDPPIDGMALLRYNGDEDYDQIGDVLKEYTGLDYSTKLITVTSGKWFVNDAVKIKSHKWGMAINNDFYNSYVTDAGIAAEVVLDNSTGAVNVIYSDNVANYLDHGTIE